LWVEPYKIGIQTVSDVDIKPVSAQTSEPFKELFDIVSPIIEFDRFPIILGGDRNISIGSVSACAKRYKDLSILQIDAQSNCSEPEDGENPHAIKSTINQIYSMLNDPKIAQVGVRSISQKEAHWVENNKPNIKTFWARQQDKWSVQDINSSLSNNVYVTIDVDALDNSIMPATAYPEPGGISWYLLMDILKNLCVKKNVVGVDIVGLAPIPNMTAPNLMVAKLLYKLIGYRFALDLGVTKKYL
jgi:agmatinase